MFTSTLRRKGSQRAKFGRKIGSTAGTTHTFNGIAADRLRKELVAIGVNPGLYPQILEQSDKAPLVNMPTMAQVIRAYLDGFRLRQAIDTEGNPVYQDAQGNYLLVNQEGVVLQTDTEGNPVTEEGEDGQRYGVPAMVLNKFGVEVPAPKYPFYEPVNPEELRQYIEPLIPTRTEQPLLQSLASREGETNPNEYVLQYDRFLVTFIRYYRLLESELAKYGGRAEEAINVGTIVVQPPTD